MILGTPGLVAALLLTLAAPLAAQEPVAREYVVHVNEPFLTFETAGDLVTVTSPDDLKGTVVPVERLEVAGVTQVTGTYGGQPFVVSIVEEACEDDMASLLYSHAAAMSWGDTLKDGCARLTTEPQPREGG